MLIQHKTEIRLDKSDYNNSIILIQVGKKIGGVSMETIQGRYTFSQPKKVMRAQDVCVRFRKRNQIPIDWTNALKYELGKSSSLKINCIKNIRFSR